MLFRGSFSSATLVGQTPANQVVNDTYQTRTLTAVSGQNLNFTTGEQIIVMFSSNGSTINPPYTTGPSGISLAQETTTAYSDISTFPLTLSGTGLPSGTSSDKRICLDFL